MFAFYSYNYLICNNTSYQFHRQMYRRTVDTCVCMRVGGGYMRKVKDKDMHQDSPIYLNEQYSLSKLIKKEYNNHSLHNGKYIISTQVKVYTDCMSLCCNYKSKCTIVCHQDLSVEPSYSKCASIFISCIIC